MNNRNNDPRLNGDMDEFNDDQPSAAVPDRSPAR